MESPSLEEENIIKDVRNLFRVNKLEKETTDAAIKGIRNLFRLEKETKAIQVRIIRNIRTFFRLGKEKAIKYRILRGIRNLEIIRH